MSFGRDLFKTKLCHLYQRGNCPRQSCSFAHGEAELRRFANAALTNGRRDLRGGDLRERLQRRHSPRSTRLSPARDSRGRQERGRSVSRSPLRGRTSRSASPPNSGTHKRDNKRLRVDEHGVNLSDVSGGPRDHAVWMDGSPKIVAKSSSSDPRDLLEEELHDVDAEVESLKDRVLQLELLVEDRTKDVNGLSLKNSELDLKLQREHEDYKRINSKLKKFLRLYLRCSRAEEEAKKTQARLLKLVEEFPSFDMSRVRSLGEESDVNILSDGEAKAVGSAPVALDHKLAAVLVTDGTDVEGKLEPAAISNKTKALKSSRLNPIENGMLRHWESNAKIPSTGLAAHAEDEIVDNYDNKHGTVETNSREFVEARKDSFKTLPSCIGLQNGLSTAPRNQYAEYAGDDQDVDVDGLDDYPSNNVCRATVSAVFH